MRNVVKEVFLKDGYSLSFFLFCFWFIISVDFILGDRSLKKENVFTSYNCEQELPAFSAVSS